MTPLQTGRNEQQWQLYWDTRTNRLHNNPEGKLLAVQIVKTLLNEFDESTSVRVLAPGCGRGDLLATINGNNTQTHLQLIGIDIDERAITYGTEAHPTISFHCADYTQNHLDSIIKPVHIILLVNTLHEVYSTAGRTENGRLNHEQGQQAVRQTLAKLADLLLPGGYLVLFDGIAPEEGDNTVTIQFKHAKYMAELEQLAAEYQPFPICYTVSGEHQIMMPTRDLAHYLIKTLFFDTPLWAIERQESYFYFSPHEFEQTITALGLHLHQTERTRPSLPNWQRRIALPDAGTHFPFEHILLVAQRPKD